MSGHGGDGRVVRRINDTKAFEECPWKGKHYRNEEVMSDGGYPACAHCVYPYYQEREEVLGKKRTKEDRKAEKKNAHLPNASAMMCLIRP